VLEFASDPTRHIAAGEIAQRYGVSSHHLAKVLSSSHARASSSPCAASGGGYRFAANARRLTLMDVIQMFEDFGTGDAARREDGDDTPVGTALAAVLAEIDEIAKATFSTITLATMLRLIERQRADAARGAERRPGASAHGVPRRPARPAGHETLDVIRGEHRSLAAVIHGLRHLVREVREHGARPTSAFSRRCCATSTHSRSAVTTRRKTGTCSGACASATRAAHASSTTSRPSTRWARARSAELVAALARYREEGRGGVPAFAAMVERVRGVPLGTHAQEEVEVMPAAEQHLLPEDWPRSTRRSAVTATRCSRRCEDRVRHAVPQDRRPARRPPSASTGGAGK